MTAAGEGWLAEVEDLLRSYDAGKSLHRRDGQAGPTSDLSIDETLLLHSIGWEPVDLVSGVAVVAIPPSTFVLGWNNTDAASASYTRAVHAAVDRLQGEARRGDAAGVIGVHVEFQVHRHQCLAILVGTAVKPSDRAAAHAGPHFVSDLSTRDFCLLHNAGWIPLGLAFGTAFVQVPRRSAGTVLRQSTANVELTNLTGAMYQAREAAMERMQSEAIGLGGTGMVDVHVDEGPLYFASHCITFTAYGTAIRLAGDSHNYLRPRMVVPVDDREQLFKVEALGAEG
ncbi:MAG: heavy metal-binding domain-containing protein [Acidimicrobiaceae bacterium]|nr:heavy metal-binding domain-containing protein [Acidimicrobiaceae bacterium]